MIVPLGSVKNNIHAPPGKKKKIVLDNGQRDQIIDLYQVAIIVMWIEQSTNAV